MSSDGAERPIDAVITWVDGQDPRHAEKLARHLPIGAPRPPATAATRYRSVGEIEYCVASLLTHAPFVRRIHIVTDEQRPALADSPALRERVRWVDHREIFRGHEALLPIFNSRSIETMLWRIDGLAEQFVYLNDDFLLIRPLTPQAWFDGAGRPVLRGRMKTQVDKHWGRLLRGVGRSLLRRPKAPSATYQRTQSLSASMLGWRWRYFSLDHVPQPLRRSTLARWFAENPRALHANASHRFRSAEQFGVCALAHHLEIAAGQALPMPDEALFYLEPAALTVPAARAALAAADNNPALLFACVQSLDLASPEVRDLVVAWLKRASGWSDATPPGNGS